VWFLIKKGKSGSACAHTSWRIEVALFPIRIFGIVAGNVTNSIFSSFFVIHQGVHPVAFIFFVSGSVVPGFSLDVEPDVNPVIHRYTA
jgi:hypothetical protein